MAEKDGRKAYRNSRTDAIRWSSKPLGYPYVPAESKAPKAEKAPNGDDAKAEG